jgi:hypothetical protein
MFLPRRPPVVSCALAAVLAAGTLAGCGASQTSQVRSKVRQFATAAHGHDYRTICSNVLAPALLADIATGGISCAKALSLALDSVRGARLVIGTITVKGSRASVVTLTQAKGEKTSLATLELTDTSAGWRIASLGNAAAGS